MTADPARGEDSANIVTSAGVGFQRLPTGSGVSVMRTAGLVFAVLLGQSFFWSTANPFALKLVVAGAALLAASKPDVALLILAAVVPFGRIISTLMSPGAPVGITEALALAYLAGWSWNRLRRAAADGQHPPGLVFGHLFAAVVVASLWVDIGVLRYWKDYWQPFLGQLFTYAARDYLNIGIESRPWAHGLGGLASVAAAARVLEGLALLNAAGVLCAEHPSFSRRLLGTLAVAAAGTAMLSIGAALQLSSTEGHSLLSVLQTSRIAVHVTKANTAGSYFVLFIPILIGLGVWSAQPRSSRPSIRMVRLAAAAAGGGLLLSALWLTRTRAAMVAGMALAAGALVDALVTGGRRRQTTRRWVVVAVAGCVMVFALLGVGFYMRTAALEAASLTPFSLPARVRMWRAAFTTLAARPFFGVGIGQFPYQVSVFDPDAALPANVGLSRFNAHNQFLETTAEVGLIGGVLFVGMFAAILWRAWRAFRTNRDPALGGAIAGVVAFLITCLGGQPLLYDIVAFPFWMVMGVLLAGGDAAPAARPARQTAAVQLRTRLIALFLIVLTLSIPVRVWQGKDGVNFALANYGFSGWHEPSDGRHYRLVRGDGTFFTYPHARWLKLPIRRDVEAGRNRLEVDVSLDGRVARTLTLADDEWQLVEFMIPAHAKRRFRRIDLAVRAAAGVAAQVRVGPADITEDEPVGRDRPR